MYTTLECTNAVKYILNHNLFSDSMCVVLAFILGYDDECLDMRTPTTLLLKHKLLFPPTKEHNEKERFAHDDAGNNNNDGCVKL